ncbi:MAG: TIM barrel protein [Pirellulales bacterium]
MDVSSVPMPSIDRRAMLRISTMALTGAVLDRSASAADDAKKRTQFQIACMTLPYARFPLARALSGIKAAGYRYVAWGTEHAEADGKRVPVMATDAPADKARELGKRCRDLGLEPLMMFSTIYPEHPQAMDVFTNRIRQAQAAGIGQVLTFGHTKGGDRKLWVERFKKLGPIARDHGVMIVIKQHGGETGTGEACAQIVRDVAHESVLVNYDAGNVMDYLSINPMPDLAKCVDLVRSFCIKDHRDWPKDEDCGPGFGEIDHYRLLNAVAWTGRAMPLCCENIFAPLVARPTEPEQVDALARRAREFLETIIAGLHMRD